MSDDLQIHRAGEIDSAPPRAAAAAISVQADPTASGIRGVLIDLDGTLLDTAADLAAAVNRMLEELHLPVVSLDAVKTYVGKGIAMLVRRAIARNLSGDADPVLVERGLPLFERAYAEESGRLTTIYPGVIEGLEALRTMGLRLACMTNKAERYTRDLLGRHALEAYFSVVACGDTLPRRKPDPMAVLWCCERLGLVPAQVLVVGDSLNDVQAARGAGCRVYCVPYGYNEGEPVTALECDRVVATLADAAALIAPLQGRAHP